MQKICTRNGEIVNKGGGGSDRWYKMTVEHRKYLFV